MGPREMAIAFSLIGRLSPGYQNSFRAAGSLMKNFGGQAQTLSDKLRDINNVIRKNDAFQKATAEYENAKKKMGEYVQQSIAMGKEINHNEEAFKNLQKQVDKTEKAFDRAKSNYKAAMDGSAFSSMPLDSLQREQAKIQKQLIARQRIQDNTGNLSAVGMYAMDFTRSIFKTGMDFEKEMSRVGAVSRATEDELGRLAASAKELGANTVWSASEAAQGMQYLAMAGFKTEQIIQTMPGMLDLASAGAVELGRAADISSNILTGFGMSAEHMGRAADVLTNTFTNTNTTLESLGETMKYCAPIAKTLGISLEQTAAMAGALGNAGIQGSDAGTALRAIMLRMSAPPASAAKAMRLYGISVSDAAGKMRPMGDIMLEIGQKMAGMSEAAKGQFINDFFGKNAASAGAALAAAALNGELAGLEETMRRQGSASEIAAKQNENTAGKMKKLTSAVEALKINAFEKLAPVVNKAGDALQAVVDAINNLDDICPGAATVIYAVAAGFGVLTLAVPMYTIVAGAASGVTGMFTVAIGQLGAAMSFLAANPIFIAIAAIAGVLAVITLLILKFDKAKEACGRFAQYFIDQWNLLADNIQEIYNMTLKPIFDFVMNGMKLIGKSMSWLSGDSGAAAIAGKTAALNVPHYAEGGVVSRPTLAMVGEGGEPEAIIPFSKMNGMGGNISVSYTINVSGGGQDAYAQVKRGMEEGTADLKRQLERILADQRRLSYA